MKQKISICIFIVLLSVAACVGLVLWKRPQENGQPKLATEIDFRTEKPEESAIPSNVEKVPETETAEFYLLEEEGRIGVFYADKKKLFMETGIPAWYLPKELQERLTDGIPFSCEDELYEFLESYSS